MFFLQSTALDNKETPVHRPHAHYAPHDIYHFVVVGDAGEGDLKFCESPRLIVCTNHTVPKIYISSGVGKAEFTVIGIDEPIHDVSLMTNRKPAQLRTNYRTWKGKRSLPRPSCTRFRWKRLLRLKKSDLTILITILTQNEKPFYRKVTNIIM